MECMTCILFFATMAASVQVEKNEKAFSLFSVVSFPNKECQTTKLTNPATSGLCLSAEECAATGGTPEGNCASSFGVCCFRSVSESGTIISNNITYIQNEKYPATYGTIANSQARAWSFILKGHPDICQFRLDFEDVLLQQPNNNNMGICGGTGDSITVENPSTSMNGFNSLCGSLSGQHIYIHYSINTDEDEVPDVLINLNIGTDNFARHWKIKTSQIECGSTDKANEGCLQWFTGPGGRIQSFNKADRSPTLLSNLLYSVCIRKWEGMCGILVSQYRNAGDENSFTLQDNAGMQNNAKQNADCTREFVDIDGVLYCGGKLAAPNAGQTKAGAIPSDVLHITVATDNANARITPSGFDLSYTQTPCIP